MLQYKNIRIPESCHDLSTMLFTQKKVTAILVIWNLALHKIKTYWLKPGVHEPRRNLWTLNYKENWALVTYQTQHHTNPFHGCNILCSHPNHGNRWQSRSPWYHHIFAYVTYFPSVLFINGTYARFQPHVSCYDNTNGLFELCPFQKTFIDIWRRYVGYV